MCRGEPASRYVTLSSSRFLEVFVRRGGWVGAELNGVAFGEAARRRRGGVEGAADIIIIIIYKNMIKNNSCERPLFSFWSACKL